MLAKTKILAGAAGLAALVGMATPAAAQYYPGQGYGYGYPGSGYGYGQNPIGQIVGQILGYGRYPYGNYGYNQYGGQRMAIDQCARAVEARLNGYRGGYYGYGNMPYGGGYGGGYGYNDRYGGGGQVQGITRVERKSYGLKVWGVASSGYRGYDGYGRGGYGNYGYVGGADLRWDCEVSYNGRIRDIDINRRSAYWRGY
jgi:hypothetical protein